MSNEHKHLTELYNHLTSAIRIWNQYMAGHNLNCRQGEYMLLQAAIYEVESKLKFDTPHTRLMSKLKIEQQDCD